MSERARTVTLLLRDWQHGDRSALEKMTPLVYDELREIAAHYMSGERAGHTFSPTALVSEAFARLLGETQPPWNDRRHFFAIAARAMRQILVDHARRRCASKRGSGVAPVALDEAAVGSGRPEEMIELDLALDALARIDERKARVVELHYFAGMSQGEIAQVFDLHVNTIARELHMAEAWIHRRLSAEA
jgi:RNA polymerase sigma factor (TIGR02999 family)